jgi:hypothetical protein
MAICHLPRLLEDLHHDNMLCEGISGVHFLKCVHWGTFRLSPSSHSLQRIFAHELGRAAMGNLDNGPGSMNNVNWNENPVMRQLGNFNDRITY